MGENMNNFRFRKFILAIALLVFPTSILAGGHYTYNGPDISGRQNKQLLKLKRENLKEGDFHHCQNQRLINYYLS